MEAVASKAPRKIDIRLNLSNNSSVQPFTCSVSTRGSTHVILF